MKTSNSAVLGSSATKSFPVRGKTFKGVSLSFIGKRMSQDDHGTIKPKPNRLFGGCRSRRWTIPGYKNPGGGISDVCIVFSTRINEP